MTRQFVSVAARSFLAAVKLCNSVTERRNTYPILGTVRLAVRSPG